MIGIGINEFVTLGNDTKVNEKGTLELNLKTGKISDEQMMKLMMEGKDVGESSTKLLIFGPMTNAYEGGRKTPQQIVKDLQDYQKVLAKFLRVYMTEDLITAQFGPTTIKDAAGVNDQAFLTGLKSDEFVAKIATNIAKKFIAVAQANNVLENPETFRLKLWRQSATKAFPKIPTGFDTWIEPMSVPTPKVIETDYDKKNNKLDSSAPAADVVPKEEIKTTESIFNETGPLPDLDSDMPFIMDESDKTTKK